MQTIDFEYYKTEGLTSPEELKKCLQDKQSDKFLLLLKSAASRDQKDIITLVARNDVPGKDLLRLESSLRSQIETIYPQFEFMSASSENFDDIKTDLQRQESEMRKDVQSDHMNYARWLILEALNRKASDIHIYSYRDGSASVYMDVNGESVYIAKRSSEFLNQVVNAALSAAAEEYLGTNSENDRVDVSMSLQLTNDNGEIIDVKLRVNKGPGVEGPHTTMRPSTGQSKSVSLEELNLSQDIIQQYKLIASKENGLLVITGPTGQGKTMTLAGVNSSIPNNKKQIQIGDPNEYEPPHALVQQYNVNRSDPGATYPALVKNALRQAPKVISIQEARDAEVMMIVIKAALTGHFCSTTYHGSDSLSALVRMIDDDIDPKILGRVLKGVGSQRLIGKLCNHCKTSAIWRGKTVSKRNQEGCKECNKGVTTRIPVAELIIVDSKVSNFLGNRDFEGLKAYIIGKGWLSMKDRAMAMVEDQLIDPWQAEQVIPEFGEETEYEYKAIRTA